MRGSSNCVTAGRFPPSRCSASTSPGRANTARRDEETDWLLDEWQSVLDDLAQDVMRCQDRVDWVAKKYLLSTFRESEGLQWADPWLQSIDLEYHNISLEQGLYYELLREGRMRRLVSEQDIKNAIFQPPSTTRAFFRGRAVARFNRRISSIQWDEVVFDDNGSSKRVSLTHAFEDGQLDRLNKLVQEAKTCDDLVRDLD